MDTWGSLPKSQVDNSTVDEEIDVKIQAHDDDPDAHLDANQALQSHKASEIIDHLAYSVLRDKLAFDRFTIDTIFESIDAWYISGNVYIGDINCLIVQTTASLNSIAFAWIGIGDATQGQSNYSQDPEFQVRVFFDDISNIIAYFGPVDPDIPNGFGFKQLNNKLYAVYFDDSDSEVVHEIYTLTEGIRLIVWCRFDHNINTHFWYINDDLVYSVVYNHTLNMDVFVEFWVKTTDTVFKRLWFSNLHYDAIYS